LSPGGGIAPLPSWLVLQLADAAFPAGGFAHSAGLEAAAQLGEVRGPGALRAFMEQALWQAGLSALPFVRAGHDDPDRLADHDARCHAFLSGHVTNRASRAQGRAFVSTCARVFGCPPILRAEEAVRARAIHGHHAPLFGAVLRALDVGADEGAAVFLHQSLRGVASAAVRLGLLGPHEAQRLQHELGPLAGEILVACKDLAPDQAAQPAPILDLFGSLHDRLYARLFQS
jgi:urease accessory protein